MLGPRSPRISYPRFQAALQARDLRFILEHFEQITPSLSDEVDVCRLIGEQTPELLQDGSARWLVGFAQRLAVLCEKRGQTV